MTAGKHAPVLVAPPEGDAIVMELRVKNREVPVGLYVFLEESDGLIADSQAMVCQMRGRDVSADGSLRVRRGGADGETALQLLADLEEVPLPIVHLEMVLAVSDRNVTLDPVEDIEVVVWDPSDGEEMVSFHPGAPGFNKCLVIGRISRHPDGWWYHPDDKPDDRSIPGFGNSLLRR